MEKSIIYYSYRESSKWSYQKEWRETLKTTTKNSIMFLILLNSIIGGTLLLIGMHGKQQSYRTWRRIGAINRMSSMDTRNLDWRWYLFQKLFINLLLYFNKSQGLFMWTLGDCHWRHWKIFQLVLVNPIKKTYAYHCQTIYNMEPSLPRNICSN